MVIFAPHIFEKTCSYHFRISLLAEFDCNWLLLWLLGKCPNRPFADGKDLILIADGKSLQSWPWLSNNKYIKWENLIAYYGREEKTDWSFQISTLKTVTKWMLPIFWCVKNLSKLAYEIKWNSLLEKLPVRCLNTHFFFLLLNGRGLPIAAFLHCSLFCVYHSSSPLSLLYPLTIFIEF